jgi:hypothetical protein
VEPPAQTAAAPLTPRAAVAWAVGIGLAGLIAWALPLASLILVWPILFVVPGWVVVRRVAPDLSPPGSVGVAVVASTYVSAHLVDVVARVTGFGRPAVVLSAIVLALFSLGFVAVRIRWLAPFARPTLAGVDHARTAYRSAWLVAGVTGLVVYLVLATNGWAESAQGWVAGGWNWSDLLVHVSIGASIAAGNFPPEVPYFAGEPLTYHWFADFHGAIASSVAGVDLIGTYFISSALFAAVLGLLVWALAWRLTGRRRVAAIAAILVCFGGGLGWIRLVGDLLAGMGDPATLVSTTSYDNTWSDGWPYFRIASVFGTGFLPHRATTLGLPGLVAAVLLVVSCLDRRPAGVLLAGILAALLAPFQFFAFPATYLIVALYVATTGAWRARTVVRDAILFLAPVVLAAPFILDAIARQRDIGAFTLVTGWASAPLSDGPGAVAFFYLTNLGIPFVLAVIAGLTARHLRARGFLLAWLLALFLVPNVIRVSAVDFDMNKYFQIMWIAVAILAGWAIRRWPSPLIAGVIVASALSPALIAIWHVSSNVVALTPAEEEAGRWIAANTPERSVFVTDPFINSPVDLAGRLRISTFGPYVANLGYDPAPRELDIKAIYCDGPDVALERMARYDATYVLSSGGILDCPGEPTDFGASPGFETVYDRDGVTIWHVREP